MSPGAPPWQGRSIASSKLRMLEFSAFLEQPQDPESVSRVTGDNFVSYYKKVFTLQTKVSFIYLFSFYYYSSCPLSLIDRCIRVNTHFNVLFLRFFAFFTIYFGLNFLKTTRAQTLAQSCLKIKLKNLVVSVSSD